MNRKSPGCKPGAFLVGKNVPRPGGRNLKEDPKTGVEIRKNKKFMEYGQFDKSRYIKKNRILRKVFVKLLFLYLNFTRLGVCAKN
jgi:hypothetical protein